MWRDTNVANTLILEREFDFRCVVTLAHMGEINPMRGKKVALGLG